MFSQDPDLYLIRRELNQLSRLVDAIEAERRQNAIQDNHRCEHDSRLSALEKKQEEMMQMLYKTQNQQTQIQSLFQSQQTQVQECQESVNFLENEIPHFRHLDAQNEELENRLAFYCPPE